jgi:hypothetical protein
MSGPHDFDWTDPETVVVPEQTATAVYFNPDDNIVIRQHRAWDEDEDHWFILTPSNAVRLARRILELAAALDGRRTALALYEPDEADADPAPKGSNAERQRRYRERHRNGVTPPVTDDRNADPVTLPIAAE